MEKFKKCVAIFTIAATFCAFSTASADIYNNGYAYEGTQRAATISPWAAVGAVAIVATIIALAVNNGHHHSGENSHSSH